MTIPDHDRSLWCAVINVAIEDATGVGRGLHDRSRSLARDRAIKWLTKPNDDFTEVCSLAGLDPEAVRERVTVIIEKATQTGKPVTRSACPGRPPQRIEFNGEVRTWSEWANHIGISRHSLMGRRRIGWTLEQMLTTPNRLANGRSDHQAEGQIRISPQGG